MPSGARDRDFAKLWFGSAVSDAGSGISMVALPLVGVLLLHTSTLQTGLLTACGTAAASLVALPAGAIIERRRKRPLMISADLARCVLLASLPIADAFGALTLTQLYVVALLNGLCSTVFNIADAAHLPTLVPDDRLLTANSRLDTTSWIANISGPAAAGALIGAFGAAVTLFTDAASDLVSALSVALIRRPEPKPVAGPKRHLRAEIAEGMRYLFGHRALRQLAISNAASAWLLTLIMPIEVLFLLRTLHATPLQYGITMAWPCLGGLAGVTSVGWLVRRFGSANVLWWSALARGPWVLLIPLARPGIGGLVIVGVAWFGVLAAASVFGTTQTTLRVQLSPPELRARINAASRWLGATPKPLAPIVGGLLGSAIGLRPVFAIAGVGLLISVLIVPRPVATATLAPEMSQAAG